MIRRARTKGFFIALLVLLPILFTLDVLFGSVTIPLDVFINSVKGESISVVHEVIIYNSRIPKAITAILCGAALSISGLLMQTLFRNPLAGPYILGISSGAGLGVAFLIMGAGLFGFVITSSLSVSLAAMIGALSILFILFFVSFKVRDVMTLLIFGVMIGAIATAIIGLIQYFTSDYQLKNFILWSLGSLSTISYSDLVILTIVIVLGVLTSFALSKNLNAILLGENYAKTIGIPLNFSRFMIILVSGSLAGTVTAFCGPIGFVGIFVPHLARLIFQTSDHKVLLPATFLMGALILLFSDVLSNFFGEGISLPINSITALLGIPIILWIIFQKKKISTGF